MSIDRILSANTTVSGQPVAFPSGPGKITVAMVELKPGAKLPVHKHEAPRIGYVLAGSLRVTNKESGESRVFSKGQAVLESVDQWHEGANDADEPVRILVIDLQRDGAGDATIVRP